MNQLLDHAMVTRLVKGGGGGGADDLQSYRQHTAQQYCRPHAHTFYSDTQMCVSVLS